MSKTIEQPRYSCALASQQTVLGIPKAVPIVHAGPGCCSKIYGMVSFSSGFQGEGYAGGAVIPCTNTDGKDVVFGGEKKLTSTIEGALKVYNGELFVVLTGCTSDIIGDDIKQIVSKFQNQKVPIVYAETGGFKYNNYRGHETVVTAIIEQLLRDATPRTEQGLVNVFSVIPYQDPFWRGDLEAIKRLLSLLGLKANILFGPSSGGINEWRNIPNAQFNLLLSPWVGNKITDTLKNLFNIPTLHYPVLPVGALETSKFLYALAEFAHLDLKKAKQIIEKSEDWYYEYFESLADFFTQSGSGLPRKFHCISDSTYALGISTFLVNELSYVPSQIFVTDNPPKKILPAIRDQFSSLLSQFNQQVYLEDDGGQIQLVIQEDLNLSDTLILGSSWEQELSNKTGAVLLEISVPMGSTLVFNKSYVGYNGGLRLLEDIYTTVLVQHAN